MADIEVKARVSVDTGDSAKKIEDVGNAAKSTGKSVSESGGNFANLKKSLMDISPAAEQASKASGIFNNALNVLRANPIIAVITALVGIVIALFQPFKKMEGVADSLGKAWGTLSGVFNTFITKILTPLIDGFTKLVELFTDGVIAVLDTLGITSKETADRFGELTDSLDDLEDTQKNNAIAMAESNRKLQEAREIAGDANVPIKERIEALKLASKIEKEELDKVVEYNRQKTAYAMEALAMEMGARQGLIDKIKEGSLESLKAARLELANMKNVDKEKLYALDQQIIAAENAAAQSAKIGKKLQSQVKALEKEEEARQKEIADKAKAEREKEAAEYQKYLNLKNKLQSDATLAAITSEELLAIKKQEKQFEQQKKEIAALKVSIEKKNELIKISEAALQDDIQKIRDKYKEQREKELEKDKKDQEEADKKQKEADDKKREDFLNKRLEQDQKVKEAEAYARDQSVKAAEAEAEAKIQLEHDRLDEIQNVGNSIISIVGQQTSVGKGIGVANALINTYQGATDALRAKSTLPSPFDVVAKIANVAAVLASGFKAVKAITSVQVPGASGGGGSVPSVPAPITPQQISTQLNSASIQGVGNAASAGVGRSFVLDTDIKDNQERQARLQRAERLG